MWKIKLQKLRKALMKMKQQRNANERAKTDRKELTPKLTQKKD